MHRSKLILLLAVLLMALCVLAAKAQDDGDDDDDDSDIEYIQNVEQCVAPVADKFDEVEFADTKRLDRVIAEFRERLFSLPAEARGVIYVYGGQVSKFDEIEEIGKTVEGKVGLGNNKVYAVDGGYRLVATAVFTIDQLDCSKSFGASPDIDPKDVQFEEFPSADTVRMSRDDIRKQVANEAFGMCPATARAMGECRSTVEIEVFVAVDQTGNVRFARAKAKNPLMQRPALETAKRWKFRPLLVNGMPKNFLGGILVMFPEGD